MDSIRRKAINTRNFVLNFTLSDAAPRGDYQLVALSAFADEWCLQPSYTAAMVN